MQQQVHKTCSLDRPYDGALSYALNDAYVKKALSYKHLKLTIIYPYNLVVPVVDHITWVPSRQPMYDFITEHNRIHMHTTVRENIVSGYAKVHPTAVIGNEGLRYARSRTGRIVGMKHIGNVVIGDHVVIGPYTTIARATLDSTIIWEHTKIDANVHIGHNCQIREKCMIVMGATIMGSVTIGENCWIGGNATIRNGVTIADNTFIGMSAVVTKDITEPGWVWKGTPAYAAKPWDGKYA